MDRYRAGSKTHPCLIGIWAFVAVILSACQSDRSSAFSPCGEANSILREANGKDSAHVFYYMFTFEGGLQMGMDSTARKVMDPVATHCGIKDWSRYAVHSRLGDKVDYLFFFRKTPVQEFSLNSFEGGPKEGVFVQVKHGTSELSCVDCLLRLPERAK